MDEEIRDNVEIALSSLLPQGLVVKVSDGVVVLEGAVEDDSAMAEAERLAWQVRGVKQVANLLVVETREIQLETLRPEQSPIAGEEVDLEAVENGEPYYPPTDPVVWPSSTAEEGLEIRGGFAPDADEQTFAPHTHETGRHGDDEISDEVIRVLALNAITADRQIEVETVDGVVYLRGRVSSLDEAEEAEAIAASVPGVDEVVEEFEID